MNKFATAQLDEQWLVDYRHRIGHCYRSAVEQSDLMVRRDFHIGGSRVRFQGIDEALLARMTRALAHLESTADAAPDLTVSCWSGSNTPYTPTSPLHSLKQDSQTTESLLALVTSAFGGKRQAPVLGSGRIRCSMQPHPNRLLLLDLEERVAFYWIEDADRIPPHEQRIPLRSLIAWWFEPRSGALLHGGAVGLSTGGVLLVGDSGVGKSSTALACLDSPLSYAADDYCLVSLDGPVHLYSLYNSMQVKHRRDLAQYRSLRDLPEELILDNQGKCSLFLQELLPQKLCSGFPLKAILTLRISGRESTRIVPATATQSLTALAPSTVRQMPTVARTTLPMITRLVASVPSYTIELGTDRDKIAATIVALLDQP